MNMPAMSGTIMRKLSRFIATTLMIMIITMSTITMATTNRLPKMTTQVTTGVKTEAVASSSDRESM